MSAAKKRKKEYGSHIKRGTIVSEQTVLECKQPGVTFEITYKHTPQRWVQVILYNGKLILIDAVKDLGELHSLGEGVLEIICLG